MVFFLYFSFLGALSKFILFVFMSFCLVSFNIAVPIICQLTDHSFPKVLVLYNMTYCTSTPKGVEVGLTKAFFFSMCSVKCAFTD